MRSKVRLVLFSIGLLAASCTSQDSPQRGTVFRYNESKGITSLDPAFARSMGNIWAVNQLFNGLVQLDDSLRVQPCLAQRWEISADGQRYTFHMRQDVRFHDHTVFAEGKGRAVTARDVLFSFNRVLDPATLSPGRDASCDDGRPHHTRPRRWARHKVHTRRNGSTLAGAVSTRCPTRL